MGRDSDAFNRWEAGQTLAAEIMLEVAGEARSDTNGDYIAAIGDVLARAEEDPAFAAQMLMPPTESELAARKTPVDPVGIHTARFTLVRAIALTHRERLAQLYEHMRDAGDFSPDAKGAGRRPCAMPVCAISPRRMMKQLPAWPMRITAWLPT